MAAPPEKRRRRLRPIEDLDWSLFEGVEGMNQTAFPSLERKEEIPPSEADEKSQVAEIRAVVDPKLEDKEGATKKVVATLPSAAKSRARAKRKAKEESGTETGDQIPNLSANGFSHSLPVPVKEHTEEVKEHTEELTDAGPAKPALNAEHPNQVEDAPKVADDAAMVDPSALKTNGFTHGPTEHSKETPKQKDNEPGAKAKPRAKRKAKQEDSKATKEVNHLPKEVDEKAVDKQAEDGKKPAKAVPKRPRAKQKVKQDPAKPSDGAAKSLKSTEEPNKVENASVVGDEAPAPGATAESNALNPIEPSEETSKPKESAAKARPRAKRKAKEEESEATNGVEQPKEVAEQTVSKEPEEERKKEADVAAKRPRAKRKAKQAEQVPEPDAKGGTNGVAEPLKETAAVEPSHASEASAVDMENPSQVDSSIAAPSLSHGLNHDATAAKEPAPKATEESEANEADHLPKEVDEKAAEKPCNGHSKEPVKEAEVSPKRPAAKRKAKQAAAEQSTKLDANSLNASEDTAADVDAGDEATRASEKIIQDAESKENVVHETKSEAEAAAVAASSGSIGDEAQVPDAKLDDTSEAKVEDDAPGPSEVPVEEEDPADLAGGIDPSVFAGIPTLRRRRRVKVRRRRQSEFFVPEPMVFEPPHDLDSQQQKAPEPPPGPDPLKAAEEVLAELLQHQALLCKEVRISIEDRLQETFQEWRCQHDRINTSAEYCVRQVLDAVMQSQNADATTLALAMEEAQQLGLPEKQSITDRLEQLKKLEEIEGIWQCLSTCLRDADRLGVVFWSREAEQLGLEVPEVLTPALEAIREEEAAKLKRMELEASFNAQAAQAHARKDVAALRTMAQHAKANSQDPSAALAALEDLGEAEEVPDEDALERLFVSSPNGQNHCFGMYVLVREERGNGMPVWRQLGGERWIYTDELGRWTVGSSKVREKGFRGSAGFIYCPQPNHGILPDKMQFWARFDEETKKWKKDEDITVASEYQEEVIEPKFSKRAKGKAAKKSAKGKGKGRGAKEEKAKARAKPKAAPRAEAKARPSFAQPAAHQNGLTQPQAMRILELPAERLADLREEVINKAYRRLALKWHPDRHCNRLKKEEANVKFVELRNAFELMRDFLKAKKALQDVVL